MSKNNLQSVFILILAGMLSVPCFLAEAIAQDRIPVCPPLGKTAKLIKPLREPCASQDGSGLSYL